MAHPHEGETGDHQKYLIETAYQSYKNVVFLHIQSFLSFKTRKPSKQYLEQF